MIEARAVAEEHIGSFYNEQKVDRRTQALRQDAGRLDITDGLRPHGYDIGTMQLAGLIYDNSGYWRIREDLAMVLEANP
jgi:hypothetical protein